MRESGRKLKEAGTNESFLLKSFINDPKCLIVSFLGAYILPRTRKITKMYELPTIT